jgi:hypothetical protein
VKWYKHMSNMIDDPKIRRLVKKFGSDGYAVYNVIIERIVRRLETESPIPDLEENSTDIADLLAMDTVRVEEILWECITQGLFEQNEVDGRLLCTKIYKFLDTRQTRSAQIKQMIAQYHDLSATVRDSPRLSEIVAPRTEQNRTEEKRIEEREEKDVTPHKIKHPEIGVPMSSSRYSSLCETWGVKVADEYIQRAADYADSKGKPYKDYAAAAAAYLRKDFPNGPANRKVHTMTMEERRKEVFGE